jgi:hypothetical protein
VNVCSNQNPVSSSRIAAGTDFGMEKIGKSDGKRLPVFCPDCDAALEYAPARIDE